MDPSTTAAADVETLKRRYAGFTGHFSRALKFAREALQEAQSADQPSPTTVVDLQDRLVQIRATQSKVSNALTELVIKDDEKWTAAYEEKAAALEEARVSITSEILQEIARTEEGLAREFRDQVHRAAQAAAQEAAEAAALQVQAIAAAQAALPVAPVGPVAPVAPVVPHRYTRSNEALRPPTLLRDNSPVEFASWVSRFQAYYTSSRMELSNIAEQQAYFRACMDAYLDGRMRDLIAADTPVNGDVDSCMAFLKAEFVARYPVFLRRLDYFRNKQPTGQDFSDWAASLRRLGEECNLADMDHNDITVMRYITGTTDSALKEKLINAVNPTVENLNAVVTRYEATKASLKAMGPSTSYAAAERGRSPGSRGKSPSQSKGKGKGKGKQGKRLPPPRGRSTSRDREGRPGKGKGKRNDTRGEEVRNRLVRENRCFKCGRDRHDEPEDCRAINATCDKCGASGHYGSVCFGRKRPTSGSGRKYSRDRTAANHIQVGSVVVPNAFGVVNAPTPKLMVRVKCSTGRTFDYAALPDTGATRSIIDEDLTKKYGLKRSRTTVGSITTAGGGSMLCKGSVLLRITHAGRSISVNAVIAVNLRAGFIIAWHDLQRLGCITSEFPAPTSKNAPKKVSLSAVSNTDTIKSLLEEYADVFDDREVTPMTGAPMHVHLRKDDPLYHPTRCLTARLIPTHYKEAAAETIELFIRSGVIEKVEGPTDWISPAFFVPKPNGKVRLVVDYTGINRFIRRPVHPFPCPRDIIRGVLPESSYFIKLDATQGYYQIPLDEASKDLTTFLLPTGRYRFTRAPMGMNSSSDEWCSRSDAALAKVPDLVKIVDDCLIQAPTEEEAVKKLRIALQCCREANITLARKKVELGNSISFAGYRITSKGVMPDPKKVEALRKFPTPENVTQLRSFLGLANQLGFFIPDLAYLTEPIQQLLKKNVAFVWLKDHADAFDEVRRVLTSDMVVHPFNPSMVTELLTDASRLYGLGYALVQRVSQESKGLRLIQCGSRSLLPAESRYATNELEALAIAWAITANRYYLLGANFTVLTDHRPLEGTFKKPLGDISNARLLRFREKLADYRFKVVWTPGKTNLIADALSRSPVFKPSPADDLDKDIECQEVFLNHVNVDPSIDFIITETERDENYAAVRSAILNNVKASDLPPEHPGKPYTQVWKDLSVRGSLIILDGTRMVIPMSLRKDILALLHIPHAGITKTRKLAQLHYYWPHIGSNIKQMIDACELCQVERPSQAPEPLLIHHPATTPMEELSMDLFQKGNSHFLIVVCRYSAYPFVIPLTGLATSVITKALRSLYLTWGYPAKVMTDGGPQFRSDFKDFHHQYGISTDNSSPYHQQSNGQAEAAVKQMKALLRKCATYADFEVSLQYWRSTPRAKEDWTPAERFLGRTPRTGLPVLTKHTPQLQRPDQRSHGGKDLPRLHPGDVVRLQDPISRRWDQTGRIISIRSGNSASRSYIVQTEAGKSLLRNRIFLKLIPPPPRSSTRPTSRPSTTTPPPPSRASISGEKKQQEKSSPHSALRRSTRLASTSSTPAVRFD